jgi:uncharacterized protein (TIGR02217 family)
MDFLPVEFPPRIAMNSMRAPGWFTTLVETFGGWTSTNQEWQDARHDYDVSLAVRTATDYQEVLAHFHAVRGRAHSFPFRDAVDYKVTSAQGVALLVEGDNYQLHRRYGATNPYDRRITRPTSGKCTFYRTRSGSQTVITPTVDYTTGRITVSGHAGGDTYQWAGEFSVPVRYLVDKLPAVVVDRRPGGGELLVQCEGITLQEVRE